VPARQRPRLLLECNDGQIVLDGSKSGCRSIFTPMNVHQKAATFLGLKAIPECNKLIEEYCKRYRAVKTFSQVACHYLPFDTSRGGPCPTTRRRIFNADHFSF
jgi:hypothetical protein